jgi:tRNA 2-thiouridine synthesizing protein B
MAILERLVTGDTVIFIENAVITLLQQGKMHAFLRQLTKKAHCYVLEPDLLVRGIAVQTIVPGIEAIEYAGFVELTVEHSHIQTW